MSFFSVALLNSPKGSTFARARCFPIALLLEEEKNAMALYLRVSNIDCIKNRLHGIFHNLSNLQVHRKRVSWVPEICHFKLIFIKFCTCLMTFMLIFELCNSAFQDKGTSVPYCIWNFSRHQNFFNELRKTSQYFFNKKIKLFLR